MLPEGNHEAASDESILITILPITIRSAKPNQRLRNIIRSKRSVNAIGYYLNASKLGRGSLAEDVLALISFREV